MFLKRSRSDRNDRARGVGRVGRAEVEEPQRSGRDKRCSGSTATRPRTPLFGALRGETIASRELVRKQRELLRTHYITPLGVESHSNTLT